MPLVKPILYLICFLTTVTSCKTPVQEQSPGPDLRYKESFLETNKYIRKRHRDHMIAFMQRASWDMTETPTGLWYMILEEGQGERIREDKLVRYSFETKLINGKLCYYADNNQPKSIVVGKGNIEAGLEEGLLLLKEGSKARFLIPPYLAHGNFGDREKIPGSAILIIEVDILEVKR